MKFTDLPDGNGPGKWIQQGVHRVMIMSCKYAETKGGKPHIKIEFADVEDTTVTITESMFVSDGFPQQRWKALYKAAYPVKEQFEAIDIDVLTNADAHELLLVGRTIWISVDRWDDRYYWGVTEFYPDSTTKPPHVPAWRPKDADTRPPKTRRSGGNQPPAGFTIPPAHGSSTPNGADDDIPF